MTQRRDDTSPWITPLQESSRTAEADASNLPERTAKEKGEEALNNCFGARQGKTEAIQDYINREEIMPLSLQKETHIALCAATGLSAPQP